MYLKCGYINWEFTGGVKEHYIILLKINLSIQKHIIVLFVEQHDGHKTMIGIDANKVLINGVQKRSRR